MIKIVVHGALGRMGSEVISAVLKAPDLKLVGGADSQAVLAELKLPDGSSVPLCADLDKILKASRPDVVVDFSIAYAALLAARTAARHNVDFISGTTGLRTEELKEFKTLAADHRTAIIAAPNFALGAVVMMELSRIAAKYLDWAEIIEMHHEKKADAPSGTAIATARLMYASRGKSFTHPPEQAEHLARGESFDGVPIHSIRLPGLVAHQEVIFGALGQTLTIRHDTINRESFMPGVLLAVREAPKYRGQFVFGLDTLLGFGETK